jgi:hypothetical protein
LIRGPSSLAPAALLATLLALASCGEPEPPPKPPLEAELIVPKPGPAGGRVQPKGLAAEASGYGTILSAPAMEYEPPAPPDPISISTPPPPPGPAVAPEIAHLIRLLPRVRPQPVDDRNILRTLEAPPMSAARVILRNGCFRLRQPGEPLVLFTVGIRAFVDPQGYLAVGAALHPTGLSGRVGERLRWEGRVDPVAEPAITGPINRICGAGRVVRIGLASSEAAQLSIEDASTAREVASRYGTPYPEARRELRACRAKYDRRWEEIRARYGDRDPPVELLPGPCTLTPPLPVPKPADCPKGTTHRGGLCLDAKGHVVPIPPRHPMG